MSQKTRTTRKPRTRQTPFDVNLLKVGRARIEEVVENFQKDLKRLQKRAEKGRRQFEKRAEGELQRLRREARKSPLVKRANKLQADFEKGPLAKRLARARREADRAARENLASVFANLRIASASDVDKLERKVATLNRKLSKLESEARRAA